MALVTENRDRLSLGSLLPKFSVLSTTGEVINPKRGDLGKGLVVAFTCNHCPYVQAYEDRMIALGRDAGSAGFRWLLINSNAANPAYPDDAMGEMKLRATKKKYPFPYAADDTQAVARAFGAACTPEFFLFDGAGVLRYTGRFDDSQDPEKVTKRYLANALADLLAGMKVREPESHPMGCSIKWIG